MALAQEDLEHIKAHLGEWLAEHALGKPPVVYEIELCERMVRLEEELRHQRELMREGFAQAEKRFEQIEKRFELMERHLEQRFEQIEKRFAQIDRRFEQVDKRFDEMLKRHDRQFLWLLGFIASSAGLLLAAIRYL